MTPKKKPTAGSSKLAGSPMFAASPGNTSPGPSEPHRPDLKPNDSATSYFGVLPSAALSTSPRQLWSSPTQKASEFPSDSRRVSLSGMSTPASALKGRFRHSQRGMTMEEVQQFGVLNDDEGSDAFKGIDLDEKFIKKLPKKLRPYYEHLAQLKNHYEEVDQVLSGELPKTIAKSFKQPPLGRQPSVNGGYGSLQRTVEGEGATPWLHGSKGSTGGPHSSSNGHQKKSSSSTITAGGENGDVEAGERDALLTSAEKEKKRDKLAKIALNVNTIVNILLTVAKLFAVLYSSSISLLASLVDSALDTLSTFIILGTNYAMGIKSDKHRYPAGKRRFEPLGVLIFSVAMIASFVQVFIEAFERARNSAGEPPVDLSGIGLATMMATIAIKLVLWLWCSRMPSSGVQALAQDAENDVWLNSMSLAFPWIGEKIGWRLLDPIGGMVLSTYIIFEWIKTLLQNFATLSGKTASPDQITRVLYLVTRFNPVLEIKEIECYHIGDDLIVEVDVILPQASSLHFAHDVSETIQCVLESLDGVLRAYVHPDYSSDNPHQHTLRLPPSNAINLPDRADGSQSEPGSVTPTNKTMMEHRNRVIGDIQEQSVESVKASGMMEHGTGLGAQV